MSEVMKLLHVRYTHTHTHTHTHTLNDKKKIMILTKLCYLPTWYFDNFNFKILAKKHHLSFLKANCSLMKFLTCKLFLVVLHSFQAVNIWLKSGTDHLSICVNDKPLLRCLSGKESACQVGDLGLIPGLGSSTGEGNGNQLQYFCQGNPMDRGAWQATFHGITKELDRVSNWRTTKISKLSK